MNEPTTVYQYFTAQGRLVYVGVTDRGVRRAHEHAESKPWWKYATGCSLEHYDTRDAALAREKYLIQTFRPPFNKQHHPGPESFATRTKAFMDLHERHLRVDEFTPESGRSPMLPQATERDRAKAYHDLSREWKRVCPCVRCGLRPGHRGPHCQVCQQQRQAARDLRRNATDG